MLPVQQHCNMLAAQYLAGCRAPEHPNHDLVHHPAPRRPLKGTLHSYAHGQLNEALDLVGNDVPHKTLLKRLHTSVVANTINSMDPNKVINTKPPRISQTEKILSRRARTRLSQLRSNYCSMLGSFKHRLDQESPDSCPLCGQSPHSVRHLFACPANPTSLEPLDLWHKPGLVADFLQL